MRSIFTKKGKVRARIATSLINEWKSGSLTAMIAQDADFYGPGASNGWPNILVFDPLSKHRTASCLVSDSLPHSKSLYDRTRGMSDSAI